MRRTSILLALAASAASVVVACSGGGGALPGFYDGWEEDRGERNQREVPRNDTDPPLVAQESAPNQQDPSPGGGGLVCSGVFACTITDKGKTTTVNIELREQNGQCTAAGAILMPDGTLKSTRDGGGTEGTWTGGGGTLTVTTEDGTVTCVRTNGSAGTSSSSSSSSSSSGSPSQGSGGGSTVVVDGGR